jgi:hypothetical protein
MHPSPVAYFSTVGLTVASHDFLVLSWIQFFSAVVSAADHLVALLSSALVVQQGTLGSVTHFVKECPAALKLNAVLFDLSDNQSDMDFRNSFSHG